MSSPYFIYIYNDRIFELGYCNAARIIARLLALWPKSGLKARGERAAQHKLGGVGTSGSHAGTF